MHTVQAGSSSIKSVVSRCYLMAERSQMLAAYPVASDVPLQHQAVSQLVSYTAADERRCHVLLFTQSIAAISDNSLVQSCSGFVISLSAHAMLTLAVALRHAIGHKGLIERGE